MHFPYLSQFSTQAFFVFQSNTFFYCCNENSIVAVKRKTKSFCKYFKTTRTIITRWGSWLKTALYYSENIIEVKKIVKVFKDDGKIMEDVKSAIEEKDLLYELFTISSNYESLYNLTLKTEKQFYTVKEVQKTVRRQYAPKGAYFRISDGMPY
jgi:hypothetical protein